MYTKALTTKKVAIVYDRVNKWGGAEKVLLALHKIFPQAPLYTSVYDKQNAKWARVFPKVHTSFLQKIPFAKRNHELLAPFMPWAFESFDFSSFDIVISVTSEAAKGIKTGPKTLHICYCLTPTRYLWSHRNEYLKGFTRFISKPVIEYLLKWDKQAAKRPDIIIGISTEVKKRIKKYYSREVQIIYPPTDLKNKPRRVSKGSYYLVVSRLVSYKKVDLVINAFNHLNKPLLIVGTGREEEKLKSLSKSKKIKFLGQISEKRLNGVYKNAKALIMPQEEDFGLVSLEAQSYGVPVIAFGRGGAIDTVIPEKTGIFFQEQNIDSLTSAIEKFEKMSFNIKLLTGNAKRHSFESFRQEILRLI